MSENFKMTVLDVIIKWFQSPEIKCNSTKSMKILLGGELSLVMWFILKNNFPLLEKRELELAYLTIQLCISLTKIQQANLHSYLVLCTRGHHSKPRNYK